MKSKKRASDYSILLLWIGLIFATVGIITIIILNLIALDQYSNIGFGIMVLGILVTFFGFIIRRMQKLGIDYFVTGAVIAYLGYLFVALPAIAFAFGFNLFKNDYLNLIPISAGLLLILLGFFTETYELNKKLLKLLTQLGSSIKSIINKINWKLVFSPFNLLSVAGITIIILTYYGFFQPYFDFWLGYFLGSVLILLNFVYHFRYETLSILVNTINMLIVIFKGILRGIKQIPTIVKEFLIWFKKVIKTFFKWSWRAIKFTLLRNYILLFGLGIGSFFLFDSFALEIRIAISSLVCFIAIIKPLVEWRHDLAKKLTSVRANIYRTAKRSRKLVSRTFHCPFCDGKIKKTTQFCPHCGRAVITCWVCTLPIQADEEVATCPHCSNIFHYSHLNAWIQMKQVCPVCKKPIIALSKKQFKDITN